ncbi:MAG: PIN domain-containing protein [Comamonas sp.]|nr:PIN domain-containing protein [Comamonas sp.]
MKYDIVLDTNVLVAALKSARGASHRLLACLGTPQGGQHLQLHLSTPLVAEYEAVPKRSHLRLSAQQAEDVIDFLCSQAHLHKIFYLWRPTLKDPDDDFVLELAVKAQASIVTWNLADFKRAQDFAVSVITPRQLLASLENQI